MVEREREIVIRPVATARLDSRRLTAKLGRALKLTPNSVRLRLPELQIPWQDAVDAVLDAIEVAGASIIPPSSPAVAEATGSARSRRIAAAALREGRRW